MLRNDFVEDLERIGPQLTAHRFPLRERDTLTHADIALLDDALTSALKLVQSRAKTKLEKHLKEVWDSPLLSRVSLFRSIGMMRQEVVHTSTLAWLLDPRQPHDFGGELCRAFARGVQLEDGYDQARSIQRRIADPNGEVTSVRAEFWLDDECRADILIEGSDQNGHWAAIVEAKVDASEQKDQLLRYDRAIERWRKASSDGTHVLRIFVSRDGRSGSSAAAGSAWGRMSYKDVAREFMAAYPGLRDREGHHFLRIYLSGLLEDVCGISCGGSLSELLKRNEMVDIERLLVDAP